LQSAANLLTEAMEEIAVGGELAGGGHGGEAPSQPRSRSTPLGLGQREEKWGGNGRGGALQEKPEAPFLKKIEGNIVRLRVRHNLSCGGGSCNSVVL
jgi:hypothetical protein